jgi:hypothetical protein
VPVWTCVKNRAPIEIRSPDRPARSQSLYRLSYSAHLYIYIIRIYFNRIQKFIVKSITLAHTTPILIENFELPLLLPRVLKAQYKTILWTGSYFGKSLLSYAATHFN